MYTGEQIKEMVDNIIGNLSDQGKVSEVLNDFVSDYTETLTTHETLTKEKESLTTLNESLRNVNNKMMTQIGDLSFLSKKEEMKKDEENQINQNENEEPYSSLFNEKGELI